MTRPHVLLSAATSLDGFLDDASPRRLVLSGPADLDRVDGERAGVDAILVGAGTVRADDPRLLVRSAVRREARVAQDRPPSPLRVILTRSGDLDPAAAVFTTPGADVLVYAPPAVAPGLAARLARTGTAPTVVGSTPEPAVVLAELAARGVVRLMVEGGAAVHTAFLAAGLADELHLVHAPVFVGDAAGHAPRFTAPGPGRMHLVETRPVGADVLMRLRAGDADERWLAEACALAERCPPSSTAFSVGAVFVGADDEILATGFSRETDPSEHAEEAALAKLAAGDPRLASATIYSSLEPCGMRASRPVTCAQLILGAGIPRVVTAWREPSTFVEGRGAEALAAGGVEVVERPEFTPLARRPNAHLLARS